jgi:hypothetical protein
MFSQTESNSGSQGERRSPAPFVIAATAGALMLLGWVLFARGSATPSIEAARPAAATTQKPTDANAFYGNGSLKVLSFYANPVEVKRGSRALVCYGVSNASSVRIEPAVGETWPSTSRCLEVTASKDTDYKLTATDSAGHQEIRSVTLHVAR